MKCDERRAPAVLKGGAKPLVSALEPPCQVAAGSAKVPAGSASWHSRHWLDQVPPTVFELLVYTDGMLLRTTDYLIDLRTKDTVKARRSYPNRMRC